MDKTNGQDLPPGLWVVATPIGNLSDLTPRAHRALENADLILCEDTRRTASLFSALQISLNHRRLERLDAHTSAHQIAKWAEELESGKSFALVTDAGTPAVSDPGSQFVSEVRRLGVRVTPVPGASAVSTLLSVSGFNETAFAFRGFFPRKPQEQIEEIEKARANDWIRIYMWFESPMRISDSLKRMSELSPDSQIVVGKELTKFYEKIFSGNSKDVSDEVAEEIASQGEVGEWCFAVIFSTKNKDAQESDDFRSAEKALQCLLTAKVSVSESVKLVCHNFGVQKKSIYELALRISGKK